MLKYLIHLKRSNHILTKFKIRLLSFTNQNKPNNINKECPPQKNANPCQDKYKLYEPEILRFQPRTKQSLKESLFDPTCVYNRISEFELRSKQLALVFGSCLLTYLLYKKVSEKPEFPEEKDDKSNAVHRIVKMPEDESEIPDQVPYLLIGGGTASFSAFRAIKTADPTAKILVVTKESFMPYMRPPLNKKLFSPENEDNASNLEFKDWAGKIRSLYYEHPDFYISCKDLEGSDNGGVAVAYGWEVTGLDIMKKEVELKGGKKIKYNKCLIATGAKPKSLGILEQENMKPKFTYYRGIEDYQQLNNILPDIKSIAIVGGGFLGCELACSLKKKNKHLNVILIAQAEGLISDILPQYLADWTAEQISKEGIEVITKALLEDANLVDNKIQFHLSGKDIKVDYVVVAVGVEPVTDLAENAGLEIDPVNKGYIVNAEMQARDNLYVAGDCASFYDPKLGRRRVEHHDNAMVTGRLAGENMAKGKGEYYKSQSMFWSDIGPISFEALGIVNSKLHTVAVFPKNKNENSDEKIKEKDLSKGVIFYLNNNTIVGIVLWNLMEKLKIAKIIIENGQEYKDLSEVAKFFNIHQTPKELKQTSKTVQ